MKKQLRITVVIVIALLFITGVLTSLRVVANTFKGPLPIEPRSEESNTSHLSMTGVITAGNAQVITIDGTYAYVGAESRFMVFDLTDPINPQYVTETMQPDRIFEIFIHNNYAFIANGDSGFRVISIVNPTAPVEVGYADAITSVYSIATASNYAYATGSELNVIDVSNPMTPVVVGGDGTISGYHVEMHGDYAYASGFDVFSIITITNPTLPQEAGFLFNLAFDFDVVGDYAYLASYFDGLEIVSVSSPKLPYIVGSHASNGYPEDIVVDNGYAYMCSTNFGYDGSGYLEKYSVTLPNSPARMETVTLESSCNDLAVSDGYLYVVTDDGLSTYATSTMVKVGSFPPEYTVFLPSLKKNFAKCMASPTLLTPTNTSQLNTLIPQFNWEHPAFPNADGYQLQVSPDPSFQSNVETLSGYYTNQPGQGSFRFPRNLLPNTLYYWRVYYLCDGGITGPKDTIWTFRTGSGGVVPSAPTLLSPADGSSLSTTPVNLQWNSVAGAVEYRVSYRPYGANWNSWRTSTDTQEELDYLDISTTYEWWVNTRNDYAFSDDSTKWQFTTPASVSTRLMSLGLEIRILDDGALLQE